MFGLPQTPEAAASAVKEMGPKAQAKVGMGGERPGLEGAGVVLGCVLFLYAHTLTQGVC